MLMIPTYVIAFFITVMAVPEGTHQFTMDVQGKTIQWTQEGTGWRAVELPRDDWGLHTIKGSQITITGEGHTLKTNMSRFLAIPEGFDGATAKTVPVAFKELGDPVTIQRETGKIVLSQTKGILFKKPVTITWETPVVGADSADAMKGQKEKGQSMADHPQAVHLRFEFFQSPLEGIPKGSQWTETIEPQVLDINVGLWRPDLQTSLLEGYFNVHHTLCDDAKVLLVGRCEYDPSRGNVGDIKVSLQVMQLRPPDTVIPRLAYLGGAPLPPFTTSLGMLGPYVLSRSEQAGETEKPLWQGTRSGWGYRRPLESDKSKVWGVLVKVTSHGPCGRFQSLQKTRDGHEIFSSNHGLKRLMLD